MVGRKMRRLFLIFFASTVFIPISEANINLTASEQQAANWKAFTLCKIKEGKSKEWAKEQLMSISNILNFDYQLTETKKISSYAKELVANPIFCDGLKNIQDFRDGARKFNKDAGKKEFENIKGNQRIALLFSAVPICKFQQGMIDKREMMKMLASGVIKEGWDMDYYEELIKNENFFLASGYYINLLKTQECQQTPSDMYGLKEKKYQATPLNPQNWKKVFTKLNKKDINLADGKVQSGISFYINKDSINRIEKEKVTFKFSPISVDRDKEPLIPQFPLAISSEKGTVWCRRNEIQFERPKVIKSRVNPLMTPHWQKVINFVCN